MNFEADDIRYFMELFLRDPSEKHLAQVIVATASYYKVIWESGK